MASPIPEDGGSGRQIGRYTLCERLSECYFGSLWSARPSDETDDSPGVAVRCIEAASLADAEAVNRLAEVAFWAMEVEYEQQPAVLDVVVTAEHLGIVSRLFEGVTLRELLDRAHRTRSAFTAPVALRIALDVLEALQVVAETAADDEEAQSQGYAHGGLNPDCIQVGTDGKTRLLDTAVAAVASREDTWRNHPLRVAYRAPEETDGEEPADARSDTFVIGVLMAAMLAGEPLLAGDSDGEGLSPGDRLEHLEVDGSLVALVRRAIDPDPDARFQRTDEMAGAIGGLGVEIARPDEVARFVEVHTPKQRGNSEEERQETRSAHQEEPVTAVAPGDYPDTALPKAEEPDQDIHERVTEKVKPLPDDLATSAKVELDRPEQATDEYEPVRDSMTVMSAGEQSKGTEPSLPPAAGETPSPAAGETPSPAVPAPPPAALMPPPAPPPARGKPPAIPARISTEKIRAWTEARHSAPPQEEPATGRKSTADVEAVPLPPLQALEVPDWLKPESEPEDGNGPTAESRAGQAPDKATLDLSAATDGAVLPETRTAPAATRTKTRTVAIGLSVLLLIAALLAVALFSSLEKEGDDATGKDVAETEAAAETEPPAAPAPPAAETEAAAKIEPPAAPALPAAKTEPAVDQKPEARAVKAEADRKPSAAPARKPTRSRRASRPRRRRAYIPDDI